MPREKIQEGTRMKRMGHWVQRQPSYWAAKPPTAGPRAGPRKGAKRKEEVEPARKMGGQMSAFVPA